MACVLPFNAIEVGGTSSVGSGTEIAGPDEFEYGSGSLELAGDDTAITTADGRIHNYRSAMTPSASCSLRGDKRANETAYASGDNATWPSPPQLVKLLYYASRTATAIVVKSFQAIIGVEYDTQANRSSVTINGSETAY